MLLLILGVVAVLRLHDLASLVKKGKIDKNKYDIILKEMEALNQNNEYFYSVNSYIYYGKKANLCRLKIEKIKKSVII